MNPPDDLPVLHRAAAFGRKPSRVAGEAHERWVQSVRQECLEHFIVFGEAHLRQSLANTRFFHNEERLHQGVGNTRLRRFGGYEPPTEIDEGAIVCRERFSGFLKHYYRQAV